MIDEVNDMLSIIFFYIKNSDDALSNFAYIPIIMVAEKLRLKLLNLKLYFQSIFNQKHHTQHDSSIHGIKKI